MEGWKSWAKQNVMPASAATSATRPAGTVRSTPSASRQSAVPDFEDAARFPCLTMRTPAAATTMAAIVEMFTVLARSPPVPTMSMAGPGTSMRWACSSMTSATARSSVTVSPLARRATRNPATCTGLASPDMICLMAQPARAVSRSSPSQSSVNTSGQLTGSVCGSVGGVARRRAGPAVMPAILDPSARTPPSPPAGPPPAPSGGPRHPPAEPAAQHPPTSHPAR